MGNRDKPTNAQLLSRGSRFQRRDAKKVVIKEAVFDERARAEYLTGFQKRNKLKKQAAAERRAEALREEKRMRRREKRRKIAAAVQEVISDGCEAPTSAQSTISSFNDGIRTTTVEIQPISFDI